MTATKTAAVFSLGRRVITPKALVALTAIDINQGLLRHMTGDWGELDDHDRRQNDAALEYGDTLISRYVSAGGAPFWIITEWDRSVTTILLPGDC